MPMTKNPADGSAVDTENPASEASFPANTPVKEMSIEEQAEYWKAQSRKHEARVKEYGLTPSEVRQMQKQLKKAQEDAMSEQERAVVQAREEGRAEVRAQLLRERIDSAVKEAVTGRNVNPVAFLDFDRDRFIKDGTIDRAALNAWVEANSTAPQPGGVPAAFMGHRETPPAAPGAAGKAEAEARFGKKQNS